MLCGSWGVVGQATAGASPPCACWGDTAYAAVLGGLSLEQLSLGVQVSPSDVLAFARPHGLPCHPSASPGDNTSCGDCKAVCSHQGECCTQTMRHWSA